MISVCNPKFQVVNHPPIKTHLTSTLLDMVSKERRGEIVDRCVIKLVHKAREALNHNLPDQNLCAAECA